MTQKCPNLRTVTVLTGKDERQEAGRMLQELATSLKKYKVSLNVDYSATLHDREIRSKTTTQGSSQRSVD